MAIMFQFGSENMSFGDSFLAGMIIAGGVVTLALIAVGIYRPGFFRLKYLPARPNRIHPLLIIVLFLLWMAAGGLLRAALEPAKISDILKDAAASLPDQLIVILAVIFTARKVFDTGLGRNGLGLERKKLPFDVAGGFIFALSAVTVCSLTVIGFTRLLEQYCPSFNPVEHRFLTAVKDASPAWKTAIFISAVVGAPLSEELLFRGMFQSMLRNYLSPWISIMAAAVLFACVHAEPQNIPSLFLLAMLLGWAYEKTGRITLPIFIHSLFNCIMIAAKLL